MRIKILMVGNSLETHSDAEMLKERGFLVYTCNGYNMNEMVDEVKPSVVFINPLGSDTAKNNNLYNDFLDNIKFMVYPVVYTLSEDDVYIINRKRTTSKDKRTIIGDNIIDSIKTALLGAEIAMPKPTGASKNVPVTYYANRA
jgi:hypothetical protein